MAASGRYRAVQKGPLDSWSVREKLALASSVLRSGDQNWVSVSRTIRAYAEVERSENYFSQKNCALQYAELLERVETPKRKRGEKERDMGTNVETPGSMIMRKLTIERIDELKQLVQQSQKRYQELKDEILSIKSGHDDDKLPNMWKEMQEKAAAAAAVSQTSESAAPAAEASDNQPSASDPVETPVTTISTTIEQQALLDTKVEEMSSDSSLPVLPPEVLEDALSLDAQANSLHGGSSLTDFIKTEPTSGTPISALPEESAAIKTEQIKATLMKEIDIKEEPVDIEVVDDVVCPPEVKVDEDTEPEVSDSAPKQPKAEEIKVSIEVKLEAPQTTTPPVETSTKQPILATEKTTPDTPVPQLVEPLRIKTPLAVSREKKSTDDLKAAADDDADSSTVEMFPDTPAGADIDEAPSSPASVNSFDTDGGSSVRGKGSRGWKRRGGSKGRGRPDGRRGGQRGGYMKHKHRHTEEDTLSSKADSSEDDESKNEESDTASTAVGAKSFVSESQPNSPASMLGLTFNNEEDEKAHKVWKKSIMLVWRAAANHKYANVFLHPVTEDIAPGYHSVVHRPKDLMTIKKNIETGIIRTTPEFQRDIMLMFTNAIMYNNSDHDVFNMATEMYDDVMHHIEQYVLTQLMVNKETPKSARHRRSDVRTESSEVPPESGGKLRVGRPRGDAGDDDRKRSADSASDTSAGGGGGKAKKKRL